MRRTWLYCLALAVPALAGAGVLIYQKHLAAAPAALLLLCLLVYLTLISAALIESFIRPLQTLSNVVASMREGDYSFRARGSLARDALGELSGEINLLADLLQKQRVRSLEATALLGRVLEVMDAPLFAVDRNLYLRLVNVAGLQLLGRSESRCLGYPAGELGLVPVLEAADQSTISFGARPARWLVRKSTFRQDGVPHTLLVLADVSLPLQAEEQAAWKRLIRVLGHELSNSLAPIKSIAGSLRMRVDRSVAEAATAQDFRKGLGVIESRADALHRFVQSYRRLAQLPPPQLKPVPLAALIERVAMLEQRVKVEVEPGPAVSLLADSDQIEQLLINLVANAADASMANGSSQVRVRWTVDAVSASILIEDNGLGIANQDNLFVPFYTTKPTGSGVGLALAQQIARGHSGEVLLVSREDAPGAIATVRLPLAGVAVASSQSSVDSRQ